MRKSIVETVQVQLNEAKNSNETFFQGQMNSLISEMTNLTSTIENKMIEQSNQFETRLVSQGNMFSEQLRVANEANEVRFQVHENQIGRNTFNDSSRHQAQNPTSPMSLDEGRPDRHRNSGNSSFLNALKAFPNERKFNGNKPDDWMLFKNFILQHCVEYSLDPNSSLKLAKACILSNDCDYVLLQLDISTIAPIGFSDTIKNYSLNFYLNSIEEFLLEIT